MLIALTKNAGTGETILDNLGPAIRIQKIPAMDNKSVGRPDPEIRLS